MKRKKKKVRRPRVPKTIMGVVRQMARQWGVTVPKVEEIDDVLRKLSGESS